MGGASLETHIGANGKDILKTTREAFVEHSQPHVARKHDDGQLVRHGRARSFVFAATGATTRGRTKPSPRDARRDDPVEESSKDAEDARLGARARFQKNLSSSFDFEPTTSYESEFMSNVMDSVDAYHDNDDDDDACVRTAARDERSAAAVASPRVSSKIHRRRRVYHTSQTTIYTVKNQSFPRFSPSAERRERVVSNLPHPRRVPECRERRPDRMRDRRVTRARETRRRAPSP